MTRSFLKLGETLRIKGLAGKIGYFKPTKEIMYINFGLLGFNKYFQECFASCSFMPTLQNIKVNYD